MKRLALIVLALLLAISGCIAEGSEWVVEDDSAASPFPDTEAQARYLMRSMTLEEKIGQLFIVSPEALTGDEYTLTLPQNADLFSAYPVGGIVFFGQNIASAAQFSALVQAFSASAQAQGLHPLFLAMHQEGGAVSALESKLGETLPLSPAQIGQTGDAAQAKAVGQIIAQRMQAFGLNLDFAPAADVWMEESDYSSDRSFGSDPETVSILVLAMADGLTSGGVIPCFKHFPGQGAAIGAAEKGRERSNRTLEQMRQTELRPFAAAIAAGAEMIQLSSMTARGIDADYPATLSSAVVQSLLREEMGFTGVIVTASLRSPAITNRCEPGEAAVTALLAGADVLLLPESLEEAIAGIRQALRQGTLTEERIDESVARILALKIQARIIQ